VFKKAANQKKMMTQLNGVITKVQKGGKQYKAALKTLQNTFKKQVDGCAAAGAPDKNDTIIDCAAQGQVYDDLLEIIDMLNGM
jgi:uncharacterized coiled-coil protein SlyX